MDQKHDVLINGVWTFGEQQQAKICPRTGKVLYYYSNCSEKLVSQSVKAARKALSLWQAQPFEKRLDLIKRFSEIIGNKKKDIANAIIEDTGKPMGEAETEVIESIDIASYFYAADYNDYLLKEEMINTELWAHKKAYIMHEPRGVYAVIKPWNYPFELPLWSIIPILIAGNTIVFKPSELSVRSSSLIAQYFIEAGLPKGVINVIPGDADTGKILVRSNIDAVSFTGSDSSGKDIAKINNGLIHLNLELGGNDAAIILKDANIDLTLSGVLWGCFTNSGQVCVSIERLIVHESIYDIFISKFVSKTNMLIRDRDFGPLISKKQKEHVLRHIESALESGGNLLTDKKYNDQGNYIKPTIIENADTNCLGWQEETFGPVVLVEKYRELDDAISKANDSRYGLGASIWTTNTKLAFDISKRLNVGMIWINEVNLPMPEIPWLGRNDSGTGINLSLESVYEASNKKIIHIDCSNKARDWWYPYK